MEQQVGSACMYYVMGLNQPHLKISLADSTEFMQSVENLTFFNGISNMITKQCYNLTIISDTYCEYYHNCSNAYLLSQLTTDSSTVKLENSKVRIFIEEDRAQCGMLVL